MQAPLEQLKIQHVVYCQTLVILDSGPRHKDLLASDMATIQSKQC